jgi:cell division septation protein DedD
VLVRGPLLLLSTLAFAACADNPGLAGESVATNLTAFGQDPIALRVARGGGLVRAYHYARLDSLIWSSSDAVGREPRVLAFDPENGLEAYADRSGATGWIDLRVGSIRKSPTPRIAQATSTDAWSLYGVIRDTIVHRSTPSGEWEFSVPEGVHSIFPLRDGGLVLIRLAGDSAEILRLRPPEARIADSAMVAAPGLALMSPLGDRLYLSFGHDLAALETRTLNELGRVRFDSEIAALATTPSGDRVFVASREDSAIAILDRYTGESAQRIAVPGPVRALRVDPIGRLLLARPDSGDSVWVISIGTNAVVATLPTVWRDDLPTVAPDGSVAIVAGRDVHFRRPGTDSPRVIVRSGAGEHWHFVYWNGFRPRAPGLDKPVVFPEDNFIVGSPAPDLAAPDPGFITPTPTMVVPPPPPDTAAITSRRSEQFNVQVAALLSEERAREIALEVREAGLSARVVASTTNGVTIYRVVLGPYSTRAEADQAGRRSGKSYWVFTGVP